MRSPLTGSSNVRKLATIVPSAIADRWLDVFGIDVGERFRAIERIEYWRCDSTGLAWYCPAEAAGDSRLYEQLEQFDWYYMRDKWEFREALQHLKPECQLLEIGVGSGAFLQAARARGHDVTGIELDVPAAERARRLGFEIHERQVFPGENDRFNGAFDAVCAFQVLEHVPDPLGFIRGMLAALRPGGRLVISVPNDRVMRVVDPLRRDLLNQPPHHMSHWDESAFRSLELVLPVRVIRAITEPLQRYHEAWLLTGLARERVAGTPSLLKRFMINRWTILPLRLLCRMGLRRMIPGHTLLVVLEYSP